MTGPHFASTAVQALAFSQRISRSSGVARHDASIMKPAAPPRVLVVDDNPDAARSLGMMLESLGAEVEVELDGPSALQSLERQPAHVVLLDLAMPGMDGFEVARRIRARDEWQDLLVVALTGWAQQGDRRRTLQHGFDYHLVKPAECDALTAVLAAAAPSPVTDVRTASRRPHTAFERSPQRPESSAPDAR
jgi:CheY-like chemotaxis protein